MFSPRRSDRLSRILIATSLLGAIDAFSAENVEVTDAPTETGHYSISMNNSFRATQGKFDPYGSYQAYPDGSNVWALSHSFRFSDRFTHDWEASAGFSVRESESRYPSGTMSSRSIGNPSVEVSYHPIQRGGFAHLAAHAGLGIPVRFGNRVVTGDPTRDTSTDGFFDGMGGGGEGGWNLRLGVGAQKRIEPLRLRAAIDASVGQPLTHNSYGDDSDGSSSDIVRGRSYSLSEGLAYTISRDWSVHGGFRQLWVGQTVADGSVVQGTASRMFSSNIGFSYAPSHDWHVGTSYSTPYPFYHYLANQSYAPTVSVSLGYSGI